MYAKEWIVEIYKNTSQVLKLIFCQEGQMGIKSRIQGRRLFKESW